MDQIVVVVDQTVVVVDQTVGLETAAEIVALALNVHRVHIREAHKLVGDEQ